CRVPLNTSALFQEFWLLIQESDKPLAGRDKFQRPLSLFVKLYRMLDPARRLRQRSTQTWKSAAVFIPQEVSARCSRLWHIFPLQYGIERIRCIRNGTLPAWRAEMDRDEPSILADNLPQGQIELPPPFHIRGITKSADHENASAFLHARA